MLTTQFSTHFMSWSVGDPANPSYIPSGLTGYTQSMTFTQRLLNTLVTFLFWIVRLVWLTPTVNCSEYPEMCMLSLKFSRW